MTEQVYNKRVRCEYTLSEQHMMKLKKQIILTEMELLTMPDSDLDTKPVLIIYDNQEIIAYKVVAAFKNSKIINVMVTSKTQSGKTGSMCATIKKYLEDSGNFIPIDNIYIITGLSSCEWKEQTKERLPNSIKSRIFHRCDLPSTFVDEIKNKKNVLIIMDEIQVAAIKGQTIYKAFKAAGLLDKQKLYENDVKILEYSATPDGTIYDLMKWNDASEKILAEVGDGYVSSFDLLQQGRVKQYKDLCGSENTAGEIDERVLNNIKEIKVDIDSYTEPKWHIIRTKNGVFQDKTLSNFKTVFGQRDEVLQQLNPLDDRRSSTSRSSEDFGTTNYDFIMYDGESEIQDINNTLKFPPVKHSVVFIKEKLRCAKTLTKQFLGVNYERYSNTIDDSTIIQGLIGRMTGYDDNGVSICYTNIDSIRKYEKLWLSKFEDKTIKWKSKTTKCKNGILHGNNTFNDPSNYGFSAESVVVIKEIVIKKFKTQEEVKQYYLSDMKPKIGGRGPALRYPNDNGYYEATFRSNKRIYSCEEISTDRNYGLGNISFRLHPCYRDIDDMNTLEWWFIHKNLD